MSRIQLGIVAECTDLPLRQAIQFAADLGCRAIQFDASGEMAPDRLGSTARRDLKNLLKSNRLELAALNAPLRRGLDVSDDQQPRLDYLRKVMDFSRDLGGTKTVVPCPIIPTDDEARLQTLRESMTELCGYGDRVGQLMTLEAGVDSAQTLVTFFESLPVSSATIAYDPVNFLVNGHDPIATLTLLQSRMAYIMARDGRAVRTSGSVSELPLGAGDIDWIVIFAMLEAYEYRGAVTVRKLNGQNRKQDLQAGIQFLRRFVPDTEFRS
jgi:L-ribulose-5-phosphate 3-epimerase